MRPPSATAASAAARSRVVTRAPGGTCDTDSVNVRRAQDGVVAAPSPFAPPQLAETPGDRQVPRPGSHPFLYPYRPLPTARAAPRSPIHGGHVHHWFTLYDILDRDDRQPVQAQQPGRIVDYARGSSVVRSDTKIR